jgi:cellulose synthase/poly-beta-1,6-N-acetylglucosamine synthase-like glycosyltransferase
MTFRPNFASVAKIDARCLQRHREVVLTLTGLFITLTASLLLWGDLGSELWARIVADHYWSALGQLTFICIVYLLIYGNLVYQLTRLGHYWRQERHNQSNRAQLETVYETDRAPPSLAILVPSYKEEREVVWQTLLSAALVEWPNRRVVLLIDDPPDPRSKEDRDALEAIRKIPSEISRLVSEPAAQLMRERRRFEERQDQGISDLRAELRRLAELYDEVAMWLRDHARTIPSSGHTNVFFSENILRKPARAHERRASELRGQSRQSSISVTAADLAREYRRLASLFAVDLSSFERKRFVNLSHEPNKAMNLNAYISLLGRSFKVSRHVNSLSLDEAPAGLADIYVPNSDYLITLDADSFLLSDYALRLLDVMEAPGNERLAVVQTPYTAVPNSNNLVERIAGATTDIQHIVHQGFTFWNSTYWVGANAILRRSALDDIKTIESERGFLVVKYIESRTVIEDTDSSIDLVNRGWGLYNYPERLAYSATPADFGSLLIQRRRWANGGLIIAPKLADYLSRSGFSFSKTLEVFFRAHYLISITATSVGVLLLLLFPFETSIHSIWLPLSAIPYYFLYGRDLSNSGYRWTDLPRVYALNLALIPVNLGGVLASLRQAVTGQKTPFLRTPKIADRTAAPAGYLLAEYSLCLYFLIGAAFDWVNGRPFHAAFGAVNGVLWCYSIYSFIGIRATFEDLAAQFRVASQPEVPIYIGQLKESGRVTSLYSDVESDRERAVAEN